MNRRRVSASEILSHAIAGSTDEASEIAVSSICSAKPVEASGLTSCVGVFFFGRHSHIHPAFHKNLFCGARLCSARESSPSFPALRSFSCTPDSVPTLLLTVYRIGVCALLAVSSFESAWSASFSYGTILRIAVIAKSTAAYPVGRICGCV